MRVIRSISEAATAGAVLVPTMGALHRGHEALIQHARTLADDGGGGLVVVSIFVNPTQFNDPGDLHSYPRTLDADCELAEGAGADVVWVPEAAEVYPHGLPDAATVKLPRACAHVESAPRALDAAH
ncbi:MAG: pantoate--beta-alanine ligase, partial [Planctomycetota bacterium]